MELFFKRHPEITNRQLWLAKKAQLGLGTIQRTLSGETGASIDTIEAIAKVLKIAPFKLLMPSQAMRTMLTEDGGASDSHVPDGLQRRPGRSATLRRSG